jgi:hypothetical protein
MLLCRRLLCSSKRLNSKIKKTFSIKGPEGRAFLINFHYVSSHSPLKPAFSGESNLFEYEREKANNSGGEEEENVANHFLETDSLTRLATVHGAVDASFGVVERSFMMFAHRHRASVLRVFTQISA